MGPMRTFAALACSAVLLAAPSGASAQTTQDRLTYVTFSGPVSIPGKTLPAGTYAFRLADSPADRHIVQVFDKDQMKLYATLLAVPADRVEAQGDPVVTFKETPSDRPPAVHYWYYAGERNGNEFVYPKNQAMTIARASGESVMAVDSDSSDFNDWKDAQTTRVSANAEPQSGATASTTTSSTTSTTTSGSAATGATQPPTASQSTTTPSQPMTSSQPSTTASQPSTTTSAASQPGTTADQRSTTPSSTAPSTAASDRDRTVGTSGRADRSELPHTASELPAIGLIGVFALAGALILRLRRAAF